MSDHILIPESVYWELKTPKPPPKPTEEELQAAAEAKGELRFRSKKGTLLHFRATSHFCPECGKNGVWLDVEMQSDYREDQEENCICWHCGCMFTIENPEYGNGFEIAEQIVEQIRSRLPAS